MTDAAATIERLGSRLSELVQSLDANLGTPCEQIRHAQEVEDLRAQLSGAYCSVCGSTDGLGCGACPEPSSAHEQGRREGIEMAANVADEEEAAWLAASEHWRGYPEGSTQMVQFDRCQARAKTAYEVATAIRALSSAPPRKPEGRLMSDLWISTPDTRSLDEAAGR